MKQDLFSTEDDYFRDCLINTVMEIVHDFGYGPEFLGETTASLLLESFFMLAEEGKFDKINHLKALILDSTSNINGHRLVN